MDASVVEGSSGVNADGARVMHAAKRFIGEVV
jgi:hypothetical protein